MTISAAGFFGGCSLGIVAVSIPNAVYIKNAATASRREPACRPAVAGLLRSLLLGYNIICLHLYCDRFPAKGTMGRSAPPF